MTIRESVRQWLQLQLAFEWQLQRTAPLFEAERRAALIDLQSRFIQLADWQAKHWVVLGFDLFLDFNP
jgi:hypothetical protein